MSRTGRLFQCQPCDGRGNDGNIGDGFRDGAHDVKVSRFGYDAAVRGTSNRRLEAHDTVAVRRVDDLEHPRQKSLYLCPREGLFPTTYTPIRFRSEPKGAHGRGDGHGAPAARAAGVLREVVGVSALASAA